MELKPRTATPHDVTPDETIGFDLDEDLFDFEDVLAESSQADEQVDVDSLLRALDEGESVDDVIGAVAESMNAKGEGVGAQSVPGRGPSFPRAAFAVLAGLTLLNLLIMGLSWEANRGVRDSLGQMEQGLAVFEEEVRQDIFDKMSTLENLTRPIASVDPRRHETMSHVEAAILEGRYREARSTLYGLLSVIDRLEDSVRDDVEARANFLLADTYRMEAEALLLEQG